MHLAIDLGAGSGRAIVGRLSGDSRAASRLDLQEVHRFHYGARYQDGHLRWDANALLAGVVEGVRRAVSHAAATRDELVSVGVDSWGVDYALVDADGHLLEDPISYRDGRATPVAARLLEDVPRQELFGRTGIQIIPINTIFQLAAHARDGLPASAAHVLLIADLCHHALCGSLCTERTNASTTQLLNAVSGDWDDELLRRIGVPRKLMPEIVEAGAGLGVLSAAMKKRTGAGAVRIIAPATHDTGSAVAGTPLQPCWAYVSSGTWSLVGVELDAPHIDAQVAQANFTNEAGVFGTTRFLKNVMGLWILECCRREWEAGGVGLGHEELIARMQDHRGPAGVIYPDHPRFFNPPGMSREVRASLAERGWDTGGNPVTLAKAVLDSLALRYASVVHTAEVLTGRHIPGVHIVGGGSRNEYLNQATADATNRPVLAGPCEATAAGNVVVQAIGTGALRSIAEAREVLSRSFTQKRYEPREPERWRDVRAVYQELEEMA